MSRDDAARMLLFSIASIALLAAAFAATAEPAPEIVGGIDPAALDAAGTETAPLRPPASRPRPGQVSENQVPEKGFGCDAVIFIDFDDMVAPDVFSNTSPLTTEYEEFYGVVFAGPAPGLGGAVLNESSNFDVTGFSPPNFFAFNNLTYAQGPETLTFSFPNNFVEISAGTGLDSGEITLACFDQRDVLVGADTITAAPALQPLRVEGDGIVRCELDFTPFAVVFDDLIYIPCDETFDGLDIPVQTPFGLAALALLLAVAGLIRLARRP